MGCFLGENGLSPLSILSTSENVCVLKIIFYLAMKKNHCTPLL